MQNAKCKVQNNGLAVEWPVLGGTESPIEVIVAVSRFYGSDPEFVLAGGGNTSVKVGERLFVKGSGHALATIGAEGFVEMDRRALEELLGKDLGSDRGVREERFKAAVMAARVHPEKGQRPSVEALLHHLMPKQYVVHTHSTVVNQFTCCVNGQKLIRELCGDQVIWVADVDPGIILAQTIRDQIKEFQKKTGRDCPRAVIMQNHGLVVGGDSAEEVKRHTDWLIGVLGRKLGEVGREAPFGEIEGRCEEARRQGDKETRGGAEPGSPARQEPRPPGVLARELVNVIGPALRGLLGTGESLKVVTFDDSPLVMSLVGGKEGKEVAVAGPLCPDQIVYCKAQPMWVEVDGGGDVVEQLRAAVREHEQKTKMPPQVVLVKGLGLFAAGDDISGAGNACVVYKDAIRVMAGARAMGGVRYMPQAQRDFFENWEVEAYRRQVAKAGAKQGRAAGKVAVVTGAAQGFGLGIALDLAEQGAHVVLADLKIEAAIKAAEEICGKYGAGRAMAIGADVTRGESVAEALHQVVRKYGGIDLFVSNAGVLKAGSVKTQPVEDFDLVTAVNYKGYFVGVQKAAPIMAVQHRARPEYWSDIIQINSKSGLQGSNKNGAYAGGKFGGIGLTQSFALELVEDGIKVNAICPGNFFEGPLWADPNHGLFVQYLRSGKVPGAKTIEDVKKFYESKVPMGRGCRPADVMKAVYYLMDQKYETGQAVPVTGGQVMLS